MKKAHKKLSRRSAKTWAGGVAQGVGWLGEGRGTWWGARGFNGPQLPQTTPIQATTGCLPLPICLYVCADAWILICAPVYTCHTHTNTYTHIHTRIHTQSHTVTHTHTYTHSHTHTYIHTHTHTHKHTHTHAHPPDCAKGMHSTLTVWVCVCHTHMIEPCHTHMKDTHEWAMSHTHTHTWLRLGDA